MAIASLQAQTYEEWECLLVDDGSTDETRDIIASIDEPRLKYTRLEKNGGRAVASQVALDAAKGEWLTTLDADDWLYPDKLATQLDALSQHKELCLLSTAMSLTDSEHNLNYVQSSTSLDELEICGPWEGLTVPCSHAAAMIKTDILRLYPYDHRLRRVQDADFMFRMLNGRHFGILPTPYYAYQHEYSPRVMEGYFESGYYARRVYAKHLHRVPVKAASAILKNSARELIYRVALPLGLGSKLFERRYRSPTTDEREQYELAYDVVRSARNKIRI